MLFYGLRVLTAVFNVFVIFRLSLIFIMHGAAQSLLYRSVIQHKIQGLRLSTYNNFEYSNLSILSSDIVYI